MILDTHLHLVEQSKLSYPWLAGAGALNRDFSYAEYALLAGRSGIEESLHMEVDVDPAQMQAETDVVKALPPTRAHRIAGAIAACRPESAGFAAYLERQRVDPFVKGFRRVLHVPSPETSGTALFRDNIRRLTGTGLTFDLVLRGDQLRLGMALADAAPDVTFILDHCGNPDLKAGRDHPWWNDIEALAKRPNVMAKISGVIAYTDPDGWTVASLRPFVEHVVGRFGWDRVVWGSDWPVCNLGGGLSAWVAATHALLRGCSIAEKTALLSGNARALWKL